MNTRRNINKPSFHSEGNVSIIINSLELVYPMRIRYSTLLFLVIVALLLVVPTYRAADVTANDVSISGLKLVQEKVELKIESGVVKSHINSLANLELRIDIENPGRSNITLFVDKGTEKNESLWENVARREQGASGAGDNVTLTLLLNDTNIKRIRIRVAMNASEYEPFSDSNQDNNEIVLKIRSISEGEEEETKEFEWYHALIALIPLVIVFMGILIFKLSSRYVAPAALAVTVILALIWFRSELGLGAAFEKMLATIGYSALWGGLDYVYAIFGAFFFLKMLEKVGAMDQLKNDFKSISSDKQHQVLLIGFCFALILATVAPAGSNFVIAAIMLVSLGFNRIGVGVLCLFGNSISSVFGLLGVSIIALKEVTGLGLLPLSGWIGIYMIALCMVAPLIMNIVYTEQGPIADLKDPDLREDVFLLMGMGMVFGVIQALVAYLAGPELPTIIAGGATLLFIIAYEKFIVKRGKKAMDEVDSTHTNRGLLARPYFYALGFMIILLLVTRLVTPVREFLTADYLTWEVAFTSISSTKVMKFSYFYSPGTILLVSTLSVPFFVKLSSKYFSDDSLDAGFIEDLGSDEIDSLEELRERTEKQDREKAGKKRTQKKVSTKLTEEMRETVKRMKEADEDETESVDKGSRKTGKGKKKKARPKGGNEEDDSTLIEGPEKKRTRGSKKAAIKRSSRKQKDKEYRDSEQEERKADKPEEDDEGKEESRGKEQKKKKKRRSTGDSMRKKEGERKTGARRRKKSRRELINDGGDFEVVFEDDDDDEVYDDEEYEVFFDEDGDDDDDYEDGEGILIDFEDDDETDGSPEDDTSYITIGELAESMNSSRMLLSSLKKTVKDVVPILFAIVSFVALANIMRYFDMTYSIATSIVDMVGGAYVFFIPTIGMSGSALTGSTTTSNVLFGGLHMAAADTLGLSPVKTAAAQVLGSSAGEMISPMNAVVIATAIGMKNKESVLIKRLIPTFFFWLILCTVISFIFISLG